MKLQLETTIGFVLVESSGHYIEIYTSEDSYQEGLINLWDYEKDKLIMEPTMSNVIREVLSTLGDFFESFAIGNIEVLEANIDELVEPDALERIKMVEKIENNND
ncbi:MAG TPA: hypothetical protein VIB80_01390 [Aquiluna sp.]